MARRQSARSVRIAATLAGGVLLLAGCGASAEPGAGTFLHEHGSEARTTAALLMTVKTDLAGLSLDPSEAELQALALDAHRAHRALLAASDWTVSEDGEEEGVSQAEKEVHEGSEALLSAIADIRLYAVARHPRSLAAYRRELAAGREYWDQGIGELWYVAKQSGPPRI